MMEDPDPGEERRTMYEKGFRFWRSLYIRATQASGLPKTCFQQPALGNCPSFPFDLDVKITHGYLSASGISLWQASDETCDISPLDRRLDIPISIDSPTPLSISAEDQRYQKWFKSDENHLSILLPAWSYILSARWAELMPEANIQYTDIKAYNEAQEQGSTIVDIGIADDGAARWWSAVLAPEGWEAYITIKNNKFRSPWSISLPASPRLSISHQNDRLSSDTAVSAATAIHFLSDYCALHDITDQSYAALSAVLFLPLLNGSRKDIILPAPKLRGALKVGSSNYKEQYNLDWMQGVHLDKLLTLSCNTRGIRSLLSSVFYDPGIACNVVSPWLQSTFAVLDSVKDTRILAHMLMSRVPHLAFFWLGGAVMGIHKDVLKEGQFGLIPTEPHAAAWTGTMQSFMQELIHPAGYGYIRRSDECRLLYIMQEEHHTRWPVCQWPPFGSTALQDTEIDVRQHADCTNHGLYYTGWKWACRNGSVYQRTESPVTPAFSSAEPVVPDITINYDALNHEEQSASENATRSIFGWLRVEGYPPNERKIHEWINIDESDDESMDKDSEKSNEPLRTNVEDWIDQVYVT